MEVLLDAVSGYENLKKIYDEGKTNIRTTFKYIHPSTHRLNNMQLDMIILDQKEYEDKGGYKISGKLDKYADRTSDIITIFVASSLGQKLETEPYQPQSCLWLFTGPKNKDDLYLGYINKYEGCYYNTTNPDQYYEMQVGTLLMNFLIELGKLFGFKTLTLMDQSNITCKYESFNQERSFRKAYILTEGNSWYGKFGFKPYFERDIDKKTEYIDLIKRIFSVDKIYEIFPADKDFYETIKKSLIDRYSGSDRRPIDYATFITTYIDGLSNYVINRQEITFGAFNKNYIKMNCMYEVVINDAIEDANLLERKGIFEIKGSYYEKMKMNL